MTAKRTIANLLASGAEPPLPDRLVKARQSRREAWVKETMAKIREADEAIDAAWDRRVDAWEAEGLSDDEIEALDLPELPEEKARDALMAQVKAICDHDRWPRECHWGGI